MTRTSQMVVVTTPKRFGYEVVDVVFGQVRVRRNQSLACQGDLLRKIGSNDIVVFVARENNNLITSDRTGS